MNQSGDPDPTPRRRRHRDWSPVVFESWIDRQIREAIERGEFDNLPGAGKPLRNLADDDWWIKAKMEREGIEPPLPNKLELRKERHEIQDRLADVHSEEQARDIIADLNTRIRESYLHRDDGPQIVVGIVPVESAITEWRRRRNR